MYHEDGHGAARRAREAEVLAKSVGLAAVVKEEKTVRMKSWKGTGVCHGLLSTLPHARSRMRVVLGLRMPSEESPEGKGLES